MAPSPSAQILAWFACRDAFLIAAISDLLRPCEDWAGFFGKIWPGGGSMSSARGTWLHFFFRREIRSSLHQVLLSAAAAPPTQLSAQHSDSIYSRGTPRNPTILMEAVQPTPPLEPCSQRISQALQSSPRPSVLSQLSPRSRRERQPKRMLFQ